MKRFCMSLKDLSGPVDLTGGVERSGGLLEETVCRGGPAHPLTPVTPANNLTPADTHTPVKQAGEAPGPEPCTPTANLKMLISAASPDIRHRQMRQCVVEEEGGEGEEGEEDGETKPSRKQRSLGLLCHKFLALYPDYPQNHVSISLDEVAASLGVERRRIYDIINVLESLTMVDRVAKNCYSWYGRQRLLARLEELQRLAQQAPPRWEGPAAGGGVSGSRKDKSLRVLSEHLVSLLLVCEAGCLTLEAAASQLIHHNAGSHSKYKTKVRRLYDIANVLSSLALIRKVHVQQDRTRKPAFQWLGPLCFSPTPVATATGRVGQSNSAQSSREVKMSRHASFNALPTRGPAHRLVNSAPCSPTSRPAAVTDQPLDCSRHALLDLSCTREAMPTSSSKPHPHSEEDSAPQRLAYLPSLSQPSVVLLYGGQRSPKRKREQEEERKEMRSSVTSDPATTEPGLPSHYLYVPHNAGLNNINFLLSASQSAAGLSLALPYLLLPSFPVAPGNAHPSPLGFLVGGAGPSAYRGVELGPPSPETDDVAQTRLLTPGTPSEPGATPSAGGFFHTPRTLGSVVPTTGRRRSSAQRRLDVGHAPAR